MLDENLGFRRGSGACRLYRRACSGWRSPALRRRARRG